MNAKLRYVCVAVVASLALAGCAPGDPASAPAGSDSDQPVAEDATTAEDEADKDAASVEEGQPMTTEEQTVEADEDIMATMTCNFLDTSGSDELNMMFGYFDRAVYVEVGEVKGKTWWVVVFEWDNADGTVDSREAYLTDVLELVSYREGTWIALPESSRWHQRNTWHNVDWDHDMLVRGQSALTMAKETLDAQ